MKGFQPGAGAICEDTDECWAQEWTSLLLLSISDTRQFLDTCDICEIQFNRQIIVLRMQNAQIFREIIYVNVFQVSGQTQRQFSPILAMTLMSVTNFHLVTQGKFSKIVIRVKLPVRSVYPLILKY